MKPEEQRFVEIEVASFQIDRVLVAVGIVDSRSNAQRLIKGGGVTWRKDTDRAFEKDGKWFTVATDWEKVVDFKQEVEPGWPLILRIGDGNWRTVMVEVPGRDGKPVSKPKMFPSLAVVMRPTERQTIEFWSELWKD